MVENKKVGYDEFEWARLQRRHVANIFNALFFDTEYSYGHNDLLQIVRNIADFFKIDEPVVIEKSNTLAEIVLNDNKYRETSAGTVNRSYKYELHYNLDMMRKAGLNNKDAYILCMVHELAHQYLRETHFLLCRNELWCQELAADYIVGIYSSIFDMATSKYKYVVRTSPQSLTHPNGYHREEVVEYARNKIKNGQFVNLPSALKSFTLFVYKRAKILNGEFDILCKNIQKAGQKKSVAECKKETHIDIHKLPDSNLLKQLILKYNEKHK